MDLMYQYGKLSEKQYQDYKDDKNINDFVDGVLADWNYNSNSISDRRIILKNNIMALSISTLTLLTEYINGVMDRANHHAQNINEVVLALVGAVIWKATQDIEVRTYQGEMANILWLTIDSRRYAIAFNHHTGRIEIRERSTQGTVIHEFDNSVTNDEVKRIFEDL